MKGTVWDYIKNVCLVITMVLSDDLNREVDNIGSKVSHELFGTQVEV